MESSLSSPLLSLQQKGHDLPRAGCMPGSERGCSGWVRGSPLLLLPLQIPLELLLCSSHLSSWALAPQGRPGWSSMSGLKSRGPLFHGPNHRADCLKAPKSTLLRNAAKSTATKAPPARGEGCKPRYICSAHPGRKCTENHSLLILPIKEGKPEQTPGGGAVQQQRVLNQQRLAGTGDKERQQASKEVELGCPSGQAGYCEGSWPPCPGLRVGAALPAHPSVKQL